MDFSKAIQHWYAHHGRTLPWRDITNPYFIWLSEIILQQTRVEQGRSYYERFTQLFPTIHDLAQATEQEVLAAWQGLGYYSRARHLHQAAKMIDAAESFPQTYETLRQLPGVGDYTASAIASFAFGLPYAVVDGNVYRVLSRFYGISDPIDTTVGRRIYKTLANNVLDRAHSAAHNQAMMDLGAMICTPRNPECDDCPLHDACEMIVSHHDPHDFPKKSRKTAVATRHFNYVIVVSHDKLLLHRRQEKDIWKGLYEPLLIESESPISAKEVAEMMRTKWQISTDDLVLRPIATDLRHVLTHRRLLVNAYLLLLEQIPTTLSAHFESVDLTALPEYPIPRLVEKIFQKIPQQSL